MIIDNASGISREKRLNGQWQLISGGKKKFCIYAVVYALKFSYFSSFVVAQYRMKKRFVFRTLYVYSTKRNDRFPKYVLVNRRKYIEITGQRERKMMMRNSMLHRIMHSLRNYDIITGQICNASSNDKTRDVEVIVPQYFSKQLLEFLPGWRFLILSYLHEWARNNGRFFREYYILYIENVKKVV